MGAAARRAALGSRLSEESAWTLSPEGNDVQVVVSDGLSAEAIHHNVGGLASKRLKAGAPLLVRYGRVKRGARPRLPGRAGGGHADRRRPGGEHPKGLVKPQEGRTRRSPR